MIQHKFTIIIPTRERPDTLYWTLKTALQQSYSNLEIIVSDNCSFDNTHEIVQSFKDPRVKYINTNKRTGMSQNWEFALSHVEEGFVTFLGDDDAFTPDAIGRVNEIVNTYKVEAVCVYNVFYGWPNNISDFYKNVLSIPKTKVNQVISSKEALRDVLSFKKNYTELPFLYKGFVHINVINKIKERSEGRFFHSMIPDVYSSLVIPEMIDYYYVTDDKIAINGGSGHSGGTAQFSPEKKKSEAAEKFIKEDNLPFHKDYIRFIPSIEIIMLECIAQAQKWGFHQNTKLDILTYIEQTLKIDVKTGTLKYNMTVDYLRELGQKHHLSTEIEALIAKYPVKPKNKFTVLLSILKSVKENVIIDGNIYDISNVYDASLWLKKASYSQAPLVSYYHIFRILLRALFTKK